ncbi:hypothetical protein [Aliiroseovarius crassostreae]|uniref:DUF695 domain-containing protein n=1 Tax=Aliiroseovarius crassostreae TaxID=154981 RepID=A0A9Q9HCI0_9RHOB|nr:hypothetical protein [Aliiroseovarius crassostreae]UWP90408.1 hypothetical protein K3J57_07030 [Aliiroseovarius crassostreae]UWP96741.1 hypothetical protein K3X48_07155 [Aliiroseovarius crassostreae]UWQ03073.1 hypothetical protein K3X44_07100 [Aliiroseovarius crassostreae]
MFIRFVCDRPVDGLDARAGFFVAAYELRDDPELDQYSAQYLEDLLAWFRENLQLPDRFSGAKHDREKEFTRGLSWFRPEADEAIDKAWELAAFLEMHGYQIELLKTDRPGNILYADDDQLVADPYAETPR